MSTVWNTNQRERSRHLDQLRETIEFLQTTHPSEFTPEEYRQVEEAILKVWAWTKLKGYVSEELLGISSDVQTYLVDLSQITQEACRHVIRDRGVQPNHRTGQFARGRFVYGTPDAEAE